MMTVMCVKIALLVYFAILMLCAVAGTIVLLLGLISGAWIGGDKRDDMPGMDDMGNGI